MKQIAFLSADNLEGFVIDDDLSIGPLQKLGWEVETVSWRKADVDWSQFTCAIIRSTWNYQQDLPGFLAAMARISERTRLDNPFGLVRWNSDKIYLRELQERGACIAPTTWGTKRIEQEDISRWFDEFATSDLVIKPTVSANADKTFRLRRGDRLPELAQIFADHSYMVQPFMNGIVEEGEFSLFYFGGDYSHTILKTPKRGDFRVQEEHGGAIKPADPSTALLRAGEEVMQLLDQAPLYARVDFVRNDHGFALMELELIEPSLYLRMGERAPERFAAAIDRWLSA